MEIPVINKSHNSLPSYEHVGDAGMDLRAELSNISMDRTYLCVLKPGQSLTIFPGGRALIPTELYMAIPSGYWVGISSRSGLALKHGVSVANPIGVIDENYRNSVGVILINHGPQPFTIEQGDRIAQAILFKYEKIEWKPVGELPESERGLDGFGSTGV